MSEITGPNVTIPPVMPPEEPPQMPPPLLAPPAAAPGLRLLPFEDREAFPGFWSRVAGMFRLVFTNPMELFDRTPAGEGFGAPWRFLLLMSIPVFLIVSLIFFVMGVGATIASLEQIGKGDEKKILAIIPVIFGAFLLLMPLFTFLGMVVGGALNHFFLWMWGGLRPGVGAQQSIRAYGYAHAFLQLGGLIPLVGPLIQIAGVVVIGMGLARMHRTDTWRGVCAVLTPIFLLCCCGILLAISIPVIIAAARH